jgi:hypothetical protein
LQVYFGLLIFLGYMVYDTQEIIERACHGDMDYIKHALTLFTDFVAVLVRILVIMVSLSYQLHIKLSMLPQFVIPFCSPSVSLFLLQLKNASDKSEEKKRKKRS